MSAFKGLVYLILLILIEFLLIVAGLDVLAGSVLDLSVPNRDVMTPLILIVTAMALTPFILWRLIHWVYEDSGR